MAVLNMDLMLQIGSALIGLMALYWTWRAYKHLTKGVLRNFVKHSLQTIGLMMAFLVWNIGCDVSSCTTVAGDYLLFPNQLFLMLAFWSMMLAGYNAEKIGREYGFKAQGDRIKSELEKRKRQKKRLQWNLKRNLLQKPNLFKNKLISLFYNQYVFK